MEANRADALHRAGRSREGLAAAIAAEADLPAGSRAARWLAMQRAEIEFSLGDWDAAEAHLPHRGRLTGTTLAYFNLTRAGLLLGRGDTRAARPLLEETARILAMSLEPQYLAGSGALRGELERREGDLDAARAVVEEAIDRIEFCSEDGERLAEVACMGVRVEADAAERARDLGDAEAERGARLRAEMMQARVQAAADDLDLPVPSAHAASAAADAARAAGEADPALYAAAAEAWAAPGAPVPRRLRALRRGRGAPARRRPRRHRRRRPRGARGRRRARLALARRRGRGPGGARPPAARRAARRAADGARRRRRPRSASRRASCRCSRCSPAAPPTARSARSCTWPRRPPACTSRGSCPSSTSAAAPRRPPWRTATGSRR